MWSMGLKGLKNFLREFDKYKAFSLILLIYFLDDVLVLLREN